MIGVCGSEYVLEWFDGTVGYPFPQSSPPESAQGCFQETIVPGRNILNYFNSIWKYFTSVKLSIVLLLTLAATSVIGTIIPQRKDPEVYFSAYGDFLYRFFDTLEIFDMYSAPWFQLLLLLITVNIIICSIDRLSVTWKIIFVKTPNFNVLRFKRLANAKEFTAELSARRLIELCEPIATKGFEYSRIEETEKGFALFAEKFRWSRLGVYTVHLSIILLLLGALIGARFGFDGYVNIPEGDTIDSIRLYNSSATIPLGFKVRCDDFDVSYYNTGTPKEFRSKLTILENEQAIIQKDIIVNDPLRYRGINMFQSSFGKMNPTDLALTFTTKGSGKMFREEVKVRQEIELPGDMGSFVVQGYRDHYDFRGQNLGEAFFARLTPKDGKPVNLVLPTRYPTFDAEIRNGDVSVSVADSNFRYYTGLQVTKDPGVWVVYAGFIMIILGCYITFFMSHQQICVEVTRSGNKSRVMVAGTSNKNQLGMSRKVEKISERLEGLSTEYPVGSTQQPATSNE